MFTFLLDGYGQARVINMHSFSSNEVVPVLMLCQTMDGLYHVVRVRPAPMVHNIEGLKVWEQTDTEQRLSYYARYDAETVYEQEHKRLNTEVFN